MKEKFNFWDTINYDNSRKVLVIPNITNPKEIEKDSFIDVIELHIKELSKLGNYYFHIILPKPVAKLNLPNVKMHIVDISENIIHMRTEFPSEIRLLIRYLDYDVVYNHLPDWFQIKKLTRKPIIGYGHWFELSSCMQIGLYNKMLNLPIELISILNMEKCFLNTWHQKNEIIKEAKVWFNDDIIKSLDDKLTVWNLGVDKNNIVDKPIEKKNIIVFNHRCIDNKGWNRFLSLMKKYRKKREDFIVWAPQLEESKISWIKNTKLNKKDYYKKLQECKVGVQMTQTHYGWSIAATDCMMNGTSMLFEEQDCYREINENADFFTNKEELFDLLDKYLDDDEYRLEKDLISISRCHQLNENNNKKINNLHKLLNYE